MQIILNKPNLVMGGGLCRLVCEVETQSTTYPLYLEFDQKWAKYVSFEVLDSQVVALLLYAMEHNLNIVCKGKISERLHRQLTEYLIPAISKNLKKYHPISISCEGFSNENFGGKVAGTGLSCGVDSFYTILKNQNHSKESGLNVQCLGLFNAGAFGQEDAEENKKRFWQRAKDCKIVADKLGCDFLAVDSNMNKFLHQDHEATHVFRTLSVPLAFQKLFKLYYFSSTFEYKKFRFTDFDPSYYDILTMPNISTESTRFELVGGETTRQGKVNFICDNPIVKQHLNVCIKDIHNCSECVKCKRTMLNLMLAGKLEEYGDCFDLSNLKKKKHRLILWAITHKHLVDIQEICELLKKQNMMNFFERILNFVCFTTKK